MADRGVGFWCIDSDHWDISWICEILGIEIHNCCWQRFVSVRGDACRGTGDIVSPSMKYTAKRERPCR
jgi:hypothetical protein